MGRRILILLALVLAPCAASDTVMDRATLRGLKALKVVVDPPGPELQSAGLTVARLQARIERKLRTAGIPLDNNAIEFVGLKLIAAHARRTPYALCLKVGLYQIVTLSRDASVKSSTDTWGSESVLLVPPKQLDQAAAESIDALLDQFIEAYRSVNPK